MSLKNFKYNNMKPFKNFREMIDRNAAEMPDKAAFKFMENKAVRIVSYSEFARTRDEFGTGIEALGNGKSHIAMVGENCYEWVLTYLTVLSSDNVFVPIDKDLPFNEIMNVLDHSDASIVCFTKAFEKQFREHSAELTKIKHFICFKPKEECDGKSFIDFEKLRENGAKLLSEGNTSYTAMDPEDLELGEIVYTSGTTGAPKGVMLSRHNLIAETYNLKNTYINYDCSLAVLPFNHTYEAVLDLLVGLYSGSTICINENLRTVADNMKRYQPEHMYLVPLFAESFYKKIWKTLEQKGKAETVKKAIKYSDFLLKFGINIKPKIFKEIHAVFGGKLKKVFVGGAPVSPELAYFFNGIGIYLDIGYGITECAPLVSGNSEQLDNPRSVGHKMPCDEFEIREPNEDGEGEIFVKGENVMMGYYKNPEATAAVLSEDGWFATGDYGKVEGDILFITGRKKNMIVLKNGKNVYPEEIEEYLGHTEEIEEVVVYSSKNSKGEETGLIAEIYPNQEFAGDKEATELEKALLDKIEEVNNSLPGYKQVHNIVLRDKEFEKTTTRKIRRSDLIGKQ